MRLQRTTNTDDDFRRMTMALDAELRFRYGAAQDAYDGHNAIEPVRTALVGYVGGEPVACGCFRAVGEGCVEMKRMFVAPAHRGRGLGGAVLRALEEWAAELGYARAVLETGKGQPEAIGLYCKMGYARTENYGPYAGLENSVCMARDLPPTAPVRAAGPAPGEG